MFEHILQLFDQGSYSHGHHVVTAFPHDPTKLVAAMGLDDSAASTPAVPIDGPVEYIFKIGVSPVTKNDDGAMLPTGTSTKPMISFIGPKGESEMIVIKHGFKSGRMGEFSVLAKDVGAVKAIKLADPVASSPSWKPTRVDVNRIGASSGKDNPSHPDGWATFNVNQAVREPVTISSSTVEARMA